MALFGRLAEIAAEYLSKGSQVYIEGSLRTRKWQDKQGNERYSTEIIGNEMQMLGGRGGRRRLGGGCREARGRVRPCAGAGRVLRGTSGAAAARRLRRRHSVLNGIAFDGSSIHVLSA